MIGDEKIYKDGLSLSGRVLKLKCVLKKYVIPAKAGTQTEIAVPISAGRESDLGSRLRGNDEEGAGMMKEKP